jgi:hypothetical protein
MIQYLTSLYVLVPTLRVGMPALDAPRPASLDNFGGYASLNPPYMSGTIWHFCYQLSSIVCFYSACRTRSVRAGIPPRSGGTIKRHGRGCKPRPAERTSRTGLQTPSGRENVTDGVANPVRQRERHGRGCKPRPAETLVVLILLDKYN